MGSQSDYMTMRDSEKILKILKVKFETRIISAHRTPNRLFDFAKSAQNDFATIIAGAGGSAHLPGMIASMTILPVIGVPIESKKLKSTALDCGEKALILSSMHYCTSMYTKVF